MAFYICNNHKLNSFRKIVSIIISSTADILYDTAKIYIIFENHKEKKSFFIACYGFPGVIRKYIFSSPDGYIALKQCILIKTGRASDRKVGYPFYLLPLHCAHAAGCTKGGEDGGGDGCHDLSDEFQSLFLTHYSPPSRFPHEQTRLIITTNAIKGI